LLALAALPVIDATLMNADHSSEPLLMCAKIRMAKEATDEDPNFVGPNVQPYETVTLMAQIGIKVVEVAREESWLFETKEQWNNLRVFDTLTA
jgi:hypothetical protein